MINIVRHPDKQKLFGTFIIFKSRKESRDQTFLKITDLDLAI